jgi:hypothetical protein
MRAGPSLSSRIAAALLAATGGGWLAADAAADPYQVEVLVFTRPADAIALAEANDHRPGCLARAQPPAKGAASSGVPTAVGTDRLQLAGEAQALQRSTAGLHVLFHAAWQQEVPTVASGPWVRIGERSQGLSGCLRAKLTPVPEIEIDLVQDGTGGDRHSLFGTARVRPGDVHYFDHPALGALVRLDALSPATVGATGIGAAPEGQASPATPPPPPATPSTTGGAPATPEPPPPPPKKPFRW